MAKVTSIPIMTKTGQATREIELPKAVTSRAVKPAVVHQVYVGYAANRRAATAHTKIRSEVSGGGKKPWRQKGTGRARQGSIRSPQWVGGGVVFGPRNERNYGHRLTDELKSQARAMVVAEYLTGGKVVAVDAFPTEPKTKQYASMFKSLKLDPKQRCLVLLTADEASHRRGLQNLAQATVMALRNLNPYDGLQFPRWVVSSQGLEQLFTFVK